MTTKAHTWHDPKSGLPVHDLHCTMSDLREWFTGCVKGVIVQPMNFANLTPAEYVAYHDVYPWMGLSAQEVSEWQTTGGVQRLTDRMQATRATLRAEANTSALVRAEVGAWDIPSVITGQPLPAMRRMPRKQAPRAIDLYLSLVAKTKARDVAAMARLTAKLASAIDTYCLNTGAVSARLVLASATFKLKPNAGLSDHHVSRVMLALDVANTHEIALALSPEFARLCYLGFFGYGHCKNAETCPPHLKTKTRPGVYDVLIDAQRPADTAASIAAAIA